MKRRLLAATLVCAVAQSAAAQQAPAPAPDDTVRTYLLEPLVVEGRLDDLRGVAVGASQGVVGKQDFRLRPLVREGEILETVPGVIITQHSGDGKSNQMFVRGFNVDHGTDFLTVVEAMPVNIPSHAHGQGYTDLNFIIPELVDHVEYKLGTYYADIGDFSAAGGAHLRLRRTLPEPLVTVGFGENGYVRAVAAGTAGVGPGTLTVGGEVKRYDGPWDVPQDLSKRSGMARYNLDRGAHHLSLLGLSYSNRWDSSDQIPTRLVDQGVISRFGQVDPTLGGNSSRHSLSAAWMRFGSSTNQRLDLYGILYDLDLYGNFTYQLEDPDAGDQVRQRDRDRKILGGSFANVLPFGRSQLTAGVQARGDFADVSLSRTRARELVDIVREDGITQLAGGLFAEVQTRWSPALRTVAGLRGDYYHFDVTSDLRANSGTANAGILSPKLSIAYTPHHAVEGYLSGGLGFHSNDARGTVQTLDPMTGDPVDPVDPLVRSRGAELGLRFVPAGRWHSTVALWTVGLDSELLFAGEVGSTEAADPSRRVGFTWTNALRLASTLVADADLSLARARFSEAEAGQDRIPGALESVVTGGITHEPETTGPFAALRVRHFGAYALTEDNAERATPTTLLNLNAGWAFGNRLRVGLGVLNLLDAEAADIQYFYASRLPGEPSGGVEDVHFHPVEPRQVRLTATWGF
jgi:hypothetical protein